MATLVLNGDHLTGAYAVGCSCGTTWRGTGPAMVFGGFNPALPIAEATVHVRLSHRTEKLNLEFSPAFSAWLERYWDQVTRDFQNLAQR